MESIPYMKKANRDLASCSRSLSKFVIENTAQIMVHVGDKEQKGFWTGIKLWINKGKVYVRKTQKMYRCKKEKSKLQTPLDWMTIKEGI